MNTAALAKFCTSAVDYADGLNAACAKFDITDGLRLQHFLAQCAHESAGFTRLEENLNYSADALFRMWPRHFTRTEANIYGRMSDHPADQEAIANRVYASRMGNGPEDTGDGWTYRGMGLIQLTGADNHRRCSLAIYGDARLLKEPELLLLPEGATLSAAWFFGSNGCNELADTDSLEGVTKRVNGGLNGLEDRREWLMLAKECFP